MTRFKSVLAAAVLSVLCGCAQHLSAPTAAPSGDRAPVSLRNFEIANIDGHRAVLLRLSRSPTLIRHSSSRKPAQIAIRMWGPPGDTDLAERRVPQLDALINQLRISREKGGLLVVLDLNGDEPPPYSVHEMADWIMIRFGPSEG
jgi:hypothetical protein